MNLAEISTFIVALIAVAGGFSAYLVSRRQNTGSVKESNAEVLWKQSQLMYDSAIKERDEFRAQRDKLMSAQADQVIPILTAILSVVQQVKKSLDDRG